MDHKELTAPCGLDCFNCPAFIAKDNERMRKFISRIKGLSQEEAFCPGCRAQNGTIKMLKRTEPCKLYRCIQKKGLSFCCECTDFPCDHLHPYADQDSEERR
ncbi:MAG: DUF3795 domain-containing protein, partial [bacterium]|nr:DUF3795 domain-containing protein [bacterium]